MLAIKNQYLKNYCPPSKIRNYKTKLEILMSNNFFKENFPNIQKSLSKQPNEEQDRKHSTPSINAILLN